MINMTAGVLMIIFVAIFLSAVNVIVNKHRSHHSVGKIDRLERIERSRIYADGKLVFDIGVNSLDSNDIEKRVIDAGGNSSSPYLKVIRTGLPPVSGFSVRLQELIKLVKEDIKNGDTQ
jgi:hypothetical protein